MVARNRGYYRTVMNMPLGHTYPTGSMGGGSFVIDAIGCPRAPRVDRPYVWWYTTPFSDDKLNVTMKFLNKDDYGYDVQSGAYEVY